MKNLGNRLNRAEQLARAMPCPECGSAGGRVEVEPAELLRRTTQRMPGFCGRSTPVDVSHEDRPGGQEMVARNRATWARALERMSAEDRECVLALVQECSTCCPRCGVGAFTGPQSLPKAVQGYLYATLETALLQAAHPDLPHPRYESDLPSPVAAANT